MPMNNSPGTSACKLVINFANLSTYVVIHGEADCDVGHACGAPHGGNEGQRSPPVRRPQNG